MQDFGAISPIFSRTSSWDFSLAINAWKRQIYASLVSRAIATFNNLYNIVVAQCSLCHQSSAFTQLLLSFVSGPQVDTASVLYSLDSFWAFIGAQISPASTNLEPPPSFCMPGSLYMQQRGECNTRAAFY